MKLTALTAMLLLLTFSLYLSADSDDPVWSEPQRIVSFFLDLSDSGELVSGVLREPSDDFFSFYEGETVYEYIDSGGQANSLFSGSVRIMEHPRAFRSLQQQLPQMHFTALIDPQNRKRINPSLILPLTSLPEQSSVARLDSLVWHAGHRGASIDVVIQAGYGRPGAFRSRPPARIVLRLPEEDEELFLFDFLSGTAHAGDGLVYQRTESGFRFEYDGFYPEQILEFTVSSPGGRRQVHSLVLPAFGAD